MSPTNRKPRRGAWLSPTAAAAHAGVPVWCIHVWVRQGHLHLHRRDDGLARIRRLEPST
jgi:hypothetical protein